MRKKIIDICETAIIIMAKFFILFLVMGIFIDKGSNYLHLYIFFVSLYVIILFIVSLIFLIGTFFELFREEPSTLFLALSAGCLLTLPVVFSAKGLSSESMKAFYTVAVGIGTNIVIDSVFKYVEIDLTANQKEFLIKKSAYMKMIFNGIYISGYLSFIVVEYISNMLPKQEHINNQTLKLISDTYFKMKDWIWISIFTVGFFIIIICISDVFSRMIKKEVKNEIPDDLQEANQMLFNDIEKEN